MSNLDIGVGELPDTREYGVTVSGGGRQEVICKCANREYAEYIRDALIDYDLVKPIPDRSGTECYDVNCGLTDREVVHVDH